MAQHFPCLVRHGDNIKKYKYLLLEKDQVTIGRSPEVTHCLLSVMVSRCHAVLKKLADGSWSITDNKSLNGVYVNDRKLTAQIPHVLKDGDRVQLGIPVKSGQPAEFIFQFHASLKVKRTRKDSADDNNPAKKRLKVHATTNKDENCPQDNRGERISNTQGCMPDSPYKAYRIKLDAHQKEKDAAVDMFKAQLEEMQRKLKAKEQEQELMREQLEQEKQERVSQAAALDQLKFKEEKMREELLSKQEALEREKQAIEKKMKAELEAQLKEREARLTEYLTNQRNALLEEKGRVQEKLQLEMDKALEEKDKLLEEQLIKQKEQLERVIEEKELKQKMLESQLKDTVAENEKQKESTYQTREDILSNLTDVMESELQCSICNELFVQATSLNCSHGFCALCINQWMERKKDCPVCRAPVTGQHRSIVLDSYIDKMVDHLTDELKERRKELVETRKAEQAKWDADHPTDSAGPSGGRKRARPIVIDSDSYSDSSAEESIDSSESDDGLPGAYYGGYGRCYNCGRRGHWASGCPEG
ncbi:E3 ubiquitin-protein ligase RNF8-like [Haliotis asinina]|uniref:E3 ubiquitin-protein ligase RNF8-like n=1 Tax=Haliotis asinina TaxID=109174 RepID=UPI00353225B8